MDTRLAKWQNRRKPVTQSHGSSNPTRRIPLRHAGPKIAGLPNTLDVRGWRGVMLWVKKIPVSLVLVTLLIVYFFASGQLPY